MDDRYPLTPAAETVIWYKRFWITIRNVIKNCTVEPVGFLFFSAIIIQVIYLVKVTNRMHSSSIITFVS